MIPKDPVMLLSYINTQLRDFYDSYEDLCKSLDLDQNEVKQKLSMIGYEYDESLISLSSRLVESMKIC